VWPADVWSLRRPPAQTRYAPRYTAFGIATLDHQLARFRRGDTLVVVAGYAMPDGGAPATRTAPPAASRAASPAASPARLAALALDDTAGRPVAVARRDSAPPTGTLVATIAGAREPATSGAPAPAWLASFEVLDTAAAAPADSTADRQATMARRWRPPAGPQRGRAARVRRPLAPLAADAPLSDLLLVRPGDYGPSPLLAAVADSAAGAPVIRAGDLFGLYWEQYAASVPRAGARMVSITATRIGTTARERLGALVGRAIVVQPVSLRYVDPVPASAPPGRYVALRWPVVPPGTYRLSVTVGPAREGAAPGAAVTSTPRGDTAAGATTAGDTASAGTPAADAIPPDPTAADTTRGDTTAVDSGGRRAGGGDAVAALVVRVVR
jgi:hypothetical protein